MAKNKIKDKKIKIVLSKILIVIRLVPVLMVRAPTCMNMTLKYGSYFREIP
jgi:hypothetical protein